MSYVELTVRCFFTSEEADITPAIIVALPADSLTGNDRPVDWTGLIQKVRDQVSGMPATGLREMTKEEVSAYRQSEKDEE